MKFQNILRNIAVRAVAVLVLAALSLSVMLYALGYFELPYIERSSGESETTKDVSEYEETIKQLETGANISGIGAETTASPSVTDTLSGQESETSGGQSAETTASGKTNPKTQGKTAVELLENGYKLSWADWTETMTLGAVDVDAAFSSDYYSGNMVSEKKLTEVRYEDGGLQFEDYETVERERRTLEVYMGYIILYSGKGTATSLLPTASGKRETVNDTERVSIFNSLGTCIGVYPAADVCPAYTRDTSDRALFIYNEKYYYLDETSGDFKLSDYDDERDNRGLYYDYDPDFGTSDCNLNIYSNYETVTMTYRIDTYYYYARFLIDWRIARELYETNPRYAELVAARSNLGKYYNLPFYVYLSMAKDAIAYEAQFTSAEETTAAPENTVTPEATESDGILPLESSAVESSAVVSSAIESSAVESTAIESSAVESSAVESSAIDSSAVDSSAIDSSAIESSAVESSAIDSSAIDSSAVDSSSIDSSAIDSSAVDSSAVTEPVTEPVTEAEKENTVIYVQTQFDAYRFIYSTSKPAVKKGYNTEKTSGYYSYVKQTLTWDSQYRYAKAFNFREGRAVTVDDNGYLKVINNSNSVKAGSFYTYHDESIALDVTPYYAEPFYKDESSVGHYYYDQGLLRVRKIQIQTYLPTIYYSDEDILIDYNGNEYELPAGYNLVSYADGVIVLERNGYYGCYNTEGYWVAQPIYASASPYIEGLCVLTLSDGSCGMIDTQGNIVLPFTYTKIENASSGIILCYTSGKGWSVFAKMAK